MSHKRNRVEIIGVCTHDKNHLWVSLITYDGEYKLGLLHKESKTFREIKTGMKFKMTIGRMIQDSEGNLWFGFPNLEGLHRLSPPFVEQNSQEEVNLISFYGSKGELDGINSLKIENNNLWIASAGNHLYKLNLSRSPIKVISTKQFGIDSIPYMSVYKDRRKKLWLSINDPEKQSQNLYEYDLYADTFRSYKGSFKGINGKEWQVLDELTDGKLLVHTPNQLVTYDPLDQTVQTYTADVMKFNEEFQLFRRFLLPSFHMVENNFLLNDSILVYGNQSGKLYNIYQNKEVASLRRHLNSLNGYVSAIPHDHNSFWANIRLGETGRFRWNGKSLEPVIISKSYREPSDFFRFKK